MKKNFILVMTLCLTVAVIGGCDNNSSSSLKFDAARFFPLTPGKSYVYKETTPDGTGTIQMQFGNPTTTEGISTPVTPITEITAEGVVGEIAYYAIENAKGLLNYGEDDVEADCMERLNPAFVIPNGLAAGKTVTQSVNLTLTGTGCPDASKIEYTVTYENEETVTVPMGVYKECAKIRILDKLMNDAGSVVSQGNKLIYLAPGVGMIKEIEFVDGAEETMELTSISDTDNTNGDYDPSIDPANFVPGVDNQYMPLVPGQTFHYLNTITEGTTITKQDIALTTTFDTKVILGVICVVVHDLVTIAGTTTILEDTLDWYAQDKDGTVWYFGEDTKKYENGAGPANTEGSWEAGVNNAKPGIVMYANPEAHINAPYRQEYLPGVAEDKAEVLSVVESANVSYGTFTNCVMTKDYSDIEPDVVEHKYFAPGVGQVRTVTVQGGTEEEVLVSITNE